MAFSAANIDPGTTPSLPVAVETINSKDYQAVKLVDGTVGSETPVGTSGNPLNTLDSQVLAELVLVLAKLNASIAVTGTFWQTTQPVSGTVTITPSGTQTVSGTVGVSGNVATTSAASSQADGHSATIGALADASSANSLVGLLKAIKAAVTGTIAVSGTFFQSTQPVSSAAASQADGHSAAIGATTDAAATTTGSVIAQLRRIANLLAGTLTVSGTVTTTPPANASTNIAQVAGTTTSVNAGTIDAGTQRVAEAGANTGTLSNVSGSASSVTVLASNTARRGGAVWNDSTSILYLKFGATASATSATVKLVPDAYWEIPANYNGLISGIWVSATGTARVTEVTA